MTPELERPKVPDVMRDVEKWCEENDYKYTPAEIRLLEDLVATSSILKLYDDTEPPLYKQTIELVGASICEKKPRQKCVILAQAITSMRDAGPDMHISINFETRLEVVLADRASRLRTPLPEFVARALSQE